MMMANDPRSVDFWTPVTYKPFVANTWKESLLESAEGYLSLSGKKLSVVPLGSRDQVVPYQERVNYWVTALKVASYCTLIVPAIAFAIKYALRPDFYYYEINHRLDSTEGSSTELFSVLPSRNPILGPNQIYQLTAEQILPHRIRIMNSQSNSDDTLIWGKQVFYGVSDLPHYSTSQFKVAYCANYSESEDKMKDVFYRVVRFDSQFPAATHKV